MDGFRPGEGDGPAARPGFRSFGSCSQIGRPGARPKPRSGPSVRPGSSFEPVPRGLRPASGHPGLVPARALIERYRERERRVKEVEASARFTAASGGLLRRLLAARRRGPTCTGGP